MKTSPRKAAFLALLYSSKRNIEETLNNWAQEEKPDRKDIALAREIASGTIKRLFTVRALAKRLPIKSLSKMNAKEKTLLYMALYQFHFMDRIPLHAIVNETVKMAKKSFGLRQGQFFNAVLRKIEKVTLDPPKSLSEWSDYYSYPEFFIRKIIDQYSEEKAKEIFDVMNKPPKVMGRRRKTHEMFFIKDPSEYATSKDVYIQNQTPVELIQYLAEKRPKGPKKILDFCAAPGGKLLLAREIYPDAELTAVDASARRIERLEENLEKYEITADVFRGRAESWISDKKFDLIILDVPCSNSGVLHKRAEARWRLENENLGDLIQLQEEILRNAFHLLSEKGVIWYLTCSILSEENEDVAKKPTREKVILPNEEGADGGYGALLSRKMHP